MIATARNNFVFVRWAAMPNILAIEGIDFYHDLLLSTCGKKSVQYADESGCVFLINITNKMPP